MLFIRLRRAVALLMPLAVCMTYLPVLTSALPLPASNEVVCTKADWRNLFLFFLVNYASHAVTVILPPGAKPQTSIPLILSAFFFPLSGLGRAIGLILSHYKYEVFNGPGLDAVRRAAVRGALVAVFRTEKWMPANHREEVYLRLIRKPRSTDRSSQEAQFQVIWPGLRPETVNTNTHDYLDPNFSDQYALYSLNHDDLIKLLREDDPDALSDAKNIPLSRSQSWAKMVISVVQIVASSITLYRSRGSQIDQYGYAAFGLTVFPYALMSLVNAVCLGIVGDYASVYVLRTRVYHEAKKRLNISERHDEKDELQQEQEANDQGKSNESKEGGDTRQDTSATAPLQKFLSGPTGAWLLVTIHTCLDTEGRMIIRLEDSGQTMDFRCTTESSSDDMDSYVFGIHTFLHLPPQSESDIDEKDKESVKEQRLGRRTLSWYAFGIFGLILGLAVPYLFIFALTRFRAQKSTVSQRAWIISWLVANQLSGLLLFVLGYSSSTFSFNIDSNDLGLTIVGITVVFLFLFSIPLVPTIGAFVTVAKMFLEFGSCTFF